MLPYYLMVLTPVLFSLIYWRYRVQVSRATEKKNIAVAVFFAIYFLLLALRHETIGSDTVRYLYHFEQMQQTTLTELLSSGRSDLGYYLLTLVLKWLPPQLFLGVVAALCVIPLGYFYYKESEGPLTSMVLFLTFPVFMMGFSGVRQMLAIALGVPAFYYAKDRKLVKFLLITLLAILMHHSAFMLLLIYPVCRARLRPRDLLWLIPIFAFVLLFSQSIFASVIQIAASLLGGEYADYEITQTGAYTMIMLLSLLLAYSFLIPDEEEIDETTRMLRNLLALAVLLQLFTPLSPLVMRLNYYFLIFIPILIPKVTNRCTKLNRQYLTVIRVVIFLFFGVYFFYKASHTDSLNIYPYIAFWEELV